MFEDNTQPTQQPETPTPQAEQPAAPESAPQAPQTPEAPKPPAKPAHPADVPVKTTQEERIWAAIGYVAFLGVVAMAMNPKSEFCKKHASQGLVIFAVWFIGLIVLAFPSFIGAIGGVILLAASIVAVLGIVKAIQSFEFKVPVLSDIAAKIPVGAIVGSVTGKAVEAPKAETPAQETEQPPAAPEQPAEPQSPAQSETPEAPQAPENTEEKPQ
ncbi:DUF4870 domain-containing protein [Patescibacteria group bacterium]